MDFKQKINDIGFIRDLIDRIAYKRIIDYRALPEEKRVELMMDR